MVGSALRQRKRVAKAPLAAERFFLFQVLFLMDMRITKNKQIDRLIKYASVKAYFLFLELFTFFLMFYMFYIIKSFKT